MLQNICSNFENGKTQFSIQCMLLYSVLWCAMDHGVPGYAMTHYDMTHYTMTYFTVLQYSMLHEALTGYTMLSYALTHYALTCYDMTQSCLLLLQDVLQCSIPTSYCSWIMLLTLVDNY